MVERIVCVEHARIDPAKGKACRIAIQPDGARD